MGEGNEIEVDTETGAESVPDTPETSVYSEEITVLDTESTGEASAVTSEIVVDDSEELPDYTLQFAFLAVLGMIFGLLVFSVLSKRWSG